MSFAIVIYKSLQVFNHFYEFRKKSLPAMAISLRTVFELARYITKEILPPYNKKRPTFANVTTYSFYPMVEAYTS